MKYFNPSYWFKLWLLSAPLFNSETRGINAKSIDNNQNIKDWASKNITGISALENYQLNLRNNNQTDFIVDNIITRKNYDSEKEIEFINENFFYKFDLNEFQYLEGKLGIGPGQYRETKSLNKVLIKNWTKYAENWTEFEKKFPELEFINFKAELGGQGETVTLNSFKISTNLRKNFWNWNVTFSESAKQFVFPYPIRNDKGFYSSESCNNNFVSMKCYNLNRILIFNVGGFHSQYSVSSLRIYPMVEKLIIETFYDFSSSTAVYRPWGTIKYDSIRLIGEVNLNPLLTLTLQQAQNIENWYKQKLELISHIKDKPNYDKEELRLSEEVLRSEFTLWLTQLRTDYIQNLVIIEHDNNILELKKEIEDIKERLTNFDEDNKCIKALVTQFRNRVAEGTVGTTVDKVFDKTPAKLIAGAVVKSLDRMLIKGAVVSLFSCVFDFFISRRNKIDFYYDSSKEDKIIHFAPTNSIINFNKIYTFQLGNNDPTKYSKIEFLGNTCSNGWGTRVKWGTYIYDLRHINDKGEYSDLFSFMKRHNNDLSKYILYNKKVNLNTVPKYLSGTLQAVEDKFMNAWMEGSQSFGLSWYEENYTNFLQVYFRQHLDWRASFSSLDCWMKIGKGIELYNIEDNRESLFTNLPIVKTKIISSNQRKRKNIISNITKWTDDFTKSINHEQHLPIDNKINFIASNITSL